MRTPLQALLELAPILGPGNQPRQIKCQHPAIAQTLGHLSLDDPLRQPLDHCRLADSGLSDQYRIVLGAPLQHLNRTADFLVATDDGIDIATFCPGGQILGISLQCLAFLLGVRMVHPALAERVNRGTQLRFVCAAGTHRLCQRVLAVKKYQQEQFGRNVRVAASLCRAVRQVQQALQVLRKTHFSGLLGDARQRINAIAQLFPQAGQVAVRLGQETSGRGILLIKQCQQYMLGRHLRMVLSQGHGLRFRQGLLELLCQSVATHGFLDPPFPIWRPIHASSTSGAHPEADSGFSQRFQQRAKIFGQDGFEGAFLPAFRMAQAQGTGMEGLAWKFLDLRPRSHR